MKFKVKNRFTNEVQFVADIDYDGEDISVKFGLAVKWAIKNGADLREANLRGADLRGADLIVANLRGANLIGADLIGADLSEANLCGADLRGADLRGADLRGADLIVANLREANLSEADLRGADLSGADLRGADLSGADLRGADLSGADLILVKLGKWDAFVGDSHTRIGCQYHTNEEWLSFSDETISGMAHGALEYWKEAKPLIELAIKTLQSRKLKESE